MAKKVTQTVLAKHIGLTSARSVRDLFERGVLTGDPQNIDLDQCRLEYIAYLRQLGARWKKDEEAPADDSRDPDVQLALFRIEQIELAKIKKRKALGELIERRDMVIAVSAAFARVKSVLLKIARKNAATIVAMDDEIEVREFLDARIREGLDELASTPVEAIGREVEADEIDLGDEEEDEV